MTATARRARTVLEVMTPGTLYRFSDLTLLTGMADERLRTRLSNLTLQGRIAVERRATRSGALFLWRLP